MFHEDEAVPLDRYYKLISSSLPATQIHCDNQGVTALIKNSEQMKKTKHIDIAYHLSVNELSQRNLMFPIFQPMRW
ncbi:hypothetical protein BJ508DRAFT_345840 [Ascobolus immersus RN42]|uniref:Uncharacterized protein n=1 Tax=Ascobolus immersus RN42 TaxID=1160509 RepID=A0A3N4HN22_ASCIM|nr:hypothetical protein BJ508DRAFT_345840 [Ascobolus immersus RN42]